MSRKKKIKINSNRSFGLFFFFIFFIIAFWSFKGEFSQIKTFPLIISFIFLVLGIINSNILTPLNKLWFKFGLLLGSIVAPIVMGVVFFLVITPTGFLLKLFGKDILNKKYNIKKKTYWINRNKENNSMKQQF